MKYLDTVAISYYLCQAVGEREVLERKCRREARYDTLATEKR